LQLSSSVVDRHYINADLDPDFHVDADQDPDPGWHQHATQRNYRALM
jgi:hypothetical protein